MLTDILKFVKGYVVIRVTGYSPERFLNLCGRHGIVLWGLRNRGTEYEMCISISGFKKLRPLVRKTKTKAVILERHGLPFILHRYRRRKLFAVGALAAAGLLYAMSLFIWNIHIEGNELLSDQTILSYLEQEQVVHGMAKRQVHGEQIEEKLREQFPEITWVSAEVKGTRLIVHVKENEDVMVDVPKEQEPADLVAAKSGTIVSMIVRSGTPAVEEGMEVEAGQLLVASRVEILNDDGGTSHVYYVHADADIVLRRTEHYTASFPMNYEKKVYTGQEHTSWYVTFFHKRLNLGKQSGRFPSEEVLTSEYQLKLTENFYLPVTIGKNVIREYQKEEAVYTKEEAEAKAQEELSLFFAKLRIKGLQIMENHVMIEVNGEICTASGTYVTEEESVREESPEIVLPEQDGQEEEGNGV